MGLDTLRCSTNTTARYDPLPDSRGSTLEVAKSMQARSANPPGADALTTYNRSKLFRILQEAT
jgi:hypothetical protein